MKQDKIVPVLSMEGKPLSPTTKGYANYLLKNGKAEVVDDIIFVIKLKHQHKPSAKKETKCTLGVDTGFSNVGLCVIEDKQEIFASTLELLVGMVERNEKRKANRNNRRAKLRHRKPLKGDRRKGKAGWLPPSTRHKIDSHIKAIEKLKSLFPITETNLEIGNFDTQKMVNPEIQGKEYQKGHFDDQVHANFRNAILYRDDYTCKICSSSPFKGKGKVKLEVHHIQYRSKQGSDSPSNLITLCTKCHTPANHKEGGVLHKMMLDKKKMGSLKEPTFMNILASILRECYPDAYISKGYETSAKRKQLGLEKSHVNDAFVIAGGDETTARLTTKPLVMKQKRRHDRSLVTWKDAQFIDIRDGSIKTGQELSCGRTTRNKNLNSENLRKYRGKKVRKGVLSSPKGKYPIETKDLVLWQGKVYVACGCQNKGAYVKIIVGDKKKAVKIEDVKVIKRNRGTYVVNEK